MKAYNPALRGRHPHGSPCVRLTLPAFLFASLCCAALPAMPNDDVLPFHATTTTLKNGLVVIVVPTGFPNLVSLQIPVQAGSRNEVEAGKTGFAHFFEHMMFRGTKDYPPEKYQAIVTAAGARQNAFTSDDFTNYHVTFAKQDLEKMLEIEADRFQHLEYPVSAFKTEALAVLGEYNKNNANPIRKLIEVQRDAAYTAHTYKHTTMGFLDDIVDMPNEFEYSRQFFDRWYRPQNAAVVVVGDVVPADVIAMVEKYFGPWKAGDFKVEIPKEPKHEKPVYVHHPWTSPTLPLVSVAFHGPAFSETEPDSAALDLLLNLEFGETSKLYQKLVIDEHKVDVLAPMNADAADPSLITILARVKDPKDSVYVRDQILATIAGTRTMPVDAQRLEEAKAHQRYALVAGLDNNEAIASTLAAFVRFRRSYDTLNNVFKLYATLTPAHLQAAAKKYFVDGGLVVATLSSDPLDKAIETPPALDSLAAQKAATAPAAMPANVVRIASSSPQIVVKLLFTAGSQDDPAGKEGLAQLAATMVTDAGSKSLTLEQIQKKLYPMAGGFNAQVDREMTVFGGSIHRDNLQAWLDVVLPQLTEPGLRPEDFQRSVEAQTNGLLIDLRSNNDEELGKERLQQRGFEGSGYAHPPQGTAAGIGAITVDDVRAFQQASYTLANLTIGVSGDVDEATVAALAKRLAGALPAGAPKKTTAIASKKPKGLEVELIQKDARATAISIGAPIDVTRAHPDYPALYLARTYLGEHRSSMSLLYQRIREIRGMNYGDYAYIEAFPRGGSLFFPEPNRARHAQLFEMWIRPVPHEQAIMATKIALHEMQKLFDRGLTQEQFETTRSYLMKNVYLLTDGQSNQLGYALDSRWYGVPEYTELMRSRLEKLTVDEVNAAIKRHLDPANLYVVMVTGIADKLKADLLADAPTTITYNSEKPPELLQEDAVIGARKLGLKPESVKIVPVDQIFAK